MIRLESWYTNTGTSAVDMTATSDYYYYPSAPCRWCGGWHSGVCSRVKRMEYHQNGTIKSVEFFGTQPRATVWNIPTKGVELNGDGEPIEHS